MNSYELLYIVDPRMPEEEFAALDQRVLNLITSNAGEVESQDTMGVRRLAYPIDRLDDGKYLLVNFKAEAEAIATVSRQLKLWQQVVRYMIVKKGE